MDDTIKCSRIGCSKCFFAGGFKVDRLGKMLKTCLECDPKSNVGDASALTGVYAAGVKNVVVVAFASTIVLKRLAVNE